MVLHNSCPENLGMASEMNGMKICSLEHEISSNKQETLDVEPFLE